MTVFWGNGPLEMKMQCRLNFIDSTNVQFVLVRSEPFSSKFLFACFV